MASPPDQKTTGPALFSKLRRRQQDPLASSAQIKGGQSEWAKNLQDSLHLVRLVSQQISSCWGPGTGDCSMTAN